MRRLVCLMLSLMLAVSLCACGEKTEAGKAYEDIPGLEDGILTVGMECAYAPYNWMQMDESNGAVPIANNPGAYANGYDVMIAKKIADHYGVALEVMAVGWDGLNPALGEGSLDAVIAGQSMTAERMEEVTMAGPYFYADIVCVARKGTAQASDTGISPLTGTGTDDNFNASEGDIKIGISVKKGNTGLADMMDAVLGNMTNDDFNNLMNQAIAIQPEI